MESWMSQRAVRERNGLFFRGHQLWRAQRGLPPDHGFPSIGYMMIHSFSHALMRQLVLECGYTAASIKERIYWSQLGAGGEPMAGLLIYTAVPDSEGTLGGLVDLGKPQHLGRHIQQALEMAKLCTSDPLCAEHAPMQDDGALHGASCHACLFAPETACERSNRYLDRSLLTTTVERADLA